MARTIGHAEVFKARGTLIVPAWQSAHYWPLLSPYGVSFAPFVVDMVSLPLYTEMVHPGKSGSALCDHKHPNTAMLALKICF